ncbi:cation diffusion facilitator family transporter [Priestia taiwanensis]|uniref:Transporter n=1 Tax=Priestia taiwanensis TaxID=1347902 RepID=A0A917AL58_9BACI|nr:cation diffusion facilitator family transporter [Priestia taiwanensis]MBM7362175.1 cation diffusion facilitator family transporter [Priestia taiwanensis]GGE59987.1 transporter [Priestia taiwanensis]
MDSTLHKRIDRAAYISMTAYIVLSILKITISYIANSNALRADGLNNLTDIGATVAIIIGLKISRKPRDADHPYGHSKMEQISSLVASFIMVAVGIQVLYGAISHVFDSKTVAPDPLSAWIAVGSAFVMFGVYKYVMGIAKSVHNKALEAAAKDNISDAYVSVGTAVGIIGAQFGFPWIDPLAAVIIGIIIIKTAWEIFSEATHMLTDGFHPEKIEEYKETVDAIEGVDHIVDIQGRMYGNAIHLDVTVEVAGELDVYKSHDIADAIQDELKEKHNIPCTHVHIEPLKEERQPQN